MEWERRIVNTSRIVVVGHVDHGKSTLMAQLLLELGLVPTDKIALAEQQSKTKTTRFEPAFLLDALQEEQEQGVSIDTTRVSFEYAGERYLFIDCPGHAEFLKNMTSGASEGDLGLLVVDCCEGIKQQTLTHLRILRILGVPQVVVAINKVDEIRYTAETVVSLEAQLRRVLLEEGMECRGVVPISALNAENLVRASENLRWFTGQPLLQTLKNEAVEPHPVTEPFRMVLQDVYRREGRRYLVGRVLSGRLEVNSNIFFSPSGKMSRVRSIEKYPNHQLAECSRGQSVALQLDESIFVERGEIISLIEDVPEVDTEIIGRIVWLSSRPMVSGEEYILKLGTAQTTCSVKLIDALTEEGEVTPVEVINGSVVDVHIRTATPIAFDRPHVRNGMSKFVICSQLGTIAAGTVTDVLAHQAPSIVVNPNVSKETGYIPRSMREDANSHRAGVIWLTGLPSSGKTTLAQALERQLFDSGFNAVALDADNLRSSLCADLGFTPEGRAENIRRLAHSAKLFLDAGFITIVACVSPYERDRMLARSIVGDESFTEVFVFCPIETCQGRDPKGLYKKAAAGKISSMTGIDAPYQPPRAPDLRIDSSKTTVEEEVRIVMELLSGKNLFSR